MSRRRQCECGDLDPYGSPCDRPLGRLRDVVWVTIVPESERGSAEASGAYTHFGGLAPVAVSRLCWRGWVANAVRQEDADFIRTWVTAAEYARALARLDAAAGGER